MNYKNKIICGDCLEVMSQLPDKCVDLVVTSPPYNLKNSTGIVKIRNCKYNKDYYFIRK